MARDTKRMEMIAENLIAHFLQRHGILVAKPYFDQEGGDLFALTNAGGIRFCRIQCKGRTVRADSPSEVKIAVDQVKNSLIVCLYVDDGSFDKLNLFVFFKENIEGWAKTPVGNQFRLPLKHDTFAGELSTFRVSERAIERVANEIMNVELPTTASFTFTGSGGVQAGGEAAARYVPNGG